MRLTHLVLGLSLLLVAAAVAVYTSGATLDPNPRGAGGSDSARDRPARPTDAQLARFSAKSPQSHRSYIDLVEEMRVTPLGPVHPALEAQADRVETGARNRLLELDEQLELTDQQKREIFPLLARSHPDYSQSLLILGVPVGASLTALGKLAADKRIHGLLDPDQQFELAYMEADADMWWTDVIARLERDLVESTGAPLATGHAPQDDPSPPNDEAPNNPAPVPVQRSTGNLYERLRDDEP